MTELEKQLLNAFDQLQTEHERQHQDFVTAYNGLVKMFETTSAEKWALKLHVDGLSENVRNLNVQLQQLKRH